MSEDELREENTRLKREVEQLRSGVLNGKSYRRQLSKSNLLSNLIISVIRLTSIEPLENIYVKFWSIWNYLIVCGIGGVIINNVVLFALVSVFPLFVSNLFAIAVAALWNYAFTVGPFGYLSGLTSRKGEKAEETW